MRRNQFQDLLQGRTGRTRALRLVPALGCVGLLAFSVSFSRDSMGGDQVVANALAKANAFLETLDARQRGKALLEFDSAKKPSWSNLPVTMVPRNGLRLGELTKPQRAAALDAIAAVLSKDGFQKVIDIMNADDQLVKGNDNKMRFGTENYYLAVFGTPSATKPWMLQFGGHHLGINVTIVGKDTVLTPTHTGAQPDSFTRNGKTVRPLGPENDLAFKLVNLLHAEQQKQAVLGARPRSLVLGPRRTVRKCSGAAQREEKGHSALFVHNNCRLTRTHGSRETSIACFWAAMPRPGPGAGRPGAVIRAAARDDAGLSLFIHAGRIYPIRIFAPSLYKMSKPAGSSPW